MSHQKTPDKDVADARYKEALELYRRLKDCGVRVLPPPRVTNVMDFGRPQYNLVDVERYRRLLNDCQKRARGKEADRRFIIIEERECENCDGTGLIEHPFYAEYFNQPEPRPPVLQFALLNGYDEPPPQEVKCMECNGTGRIRTEVTLEHALEALGR